MDEELKKSALEYHRLPRPGKVSILATKQLTNQRDLALAYSPGVAVACEEIKRNPDEAVHLTSRANLIAVGNIDTERRNPEWYLPGEEMRPEHQHLALRRNGIPDEVANAALFLASDEASYITGDRITCSGGRFPGM